MLSSVCVCAGSRSFAIIWKPDWSDGDCRFIRFRTAHPRIPKILAADLMLEAVVLATHELRGLRGPPGAAVQPEAVWPVMLLVQSEPARPLLGLVKHRVQVQRAKALELGCLVLEPSVLYCFV